MPQNRIAAYIRFMNATMENSSLTVSREKKLELQLRFQKRLQFITNKINSAKDTDDILLNLQEEILSLFDADRITIYIVDGVRKEIVSRFKTGNEVSEIRVPITKQSIAGYCALSGKVVNIADAYDENELAGINPELRFDRNWDQKSGYMTKQVLKMPRRCLKSRGCWGSPFSTITGRPAGKGPPNSTIS
jgi:hypothetical protein